MLSCHERRVRVDKCRAVALRYWMISLTESAAKKIESLQNETADASKRLRIFVEAGGCSGLEYGMSFDVPKEGDQELESQGVKFLMDATSLAYLDGSVVDFDDGLQ